MDSSICKYSQKYSLIDSCQTNKTPTSVTNIQAFFGKEDAEEHDL